MNKTKLLFSLAILCATVAVVRSHIINGQEPGQDINIYAIETRASQGRIRGNCAG